MSKIIKMNLSVQSINNAMKELQTYKRDFLNKVELLRKKIAGLMADKAQSLFDGAIVDDVINDKRQAQVTVSLSDTGNVTYVIAYGSDAVWVEFGAGVFYNGQAGNSPHPKGTELGYTIGGYGKGYGRRQVWGFYESGELKLTRGTPAVMPMYKAFSEVCNDIYNIAKEVFR